VTERQEKECACKSVFERETTTRIERDRKKSVYVSGLREREIERERGREREREGERERGKRACMSLV